MEYLLISATLIALLISIVGCGDGVAYSARDRRARFDKIITNDFEQFTDDSDYFWLMEQRTHLSPWKLE